jgi:hypothetical protein
VLEFKRLELEHLDRLSAEQKDQLFSNEAEYESSKHSIRTYGEVAFCLAGIKPCVLLAHAATPAYFKGVVQACLRPVMAQFGLAEKGFVLQEIRCATV